MKSLLPTFMPMKISLCYAVDNEYFTKWYRVKINFGQKKPFHFGKVFIVLDNLEAIRVYLWRWVYR
ncbi:MAG: hypothetical protein EOO96_12705 [Pedobacter sp.]|nr:MAG: hypothetical protein EOO96_12705 [Pedobacter sp.]